MLVEAVCNTVILTDPLTGMWPGPVEERTLPTFFKSTGPTGGQDIIIVYREQWDTEEEVIEVKEDEQE